MSTRVNAEEIQSTRTERFLAVVLAVFLLIGAVWFYVKLHEWVAPDVHTAASEAAVARAAWIAAGLRLGLIVLWLAGSYWLIQVLRRRGSRAQPLGLAAAAVGVLLSLGYATDYITDYIDFLDLGPIVLSVLGVAATLAAFVGLQRYLARRIPGRRVRKGECPFCGYPIRGDGPHCEGCGREVVAECGVCGQPRRVGSTHCAACGAA